MTRAQPIFHDLPEHPVSRQAQSLQGIEAAAAEHRRQGAKVRVTSMVGFPASHVDLGWLQDRIRAHWETFEGSALQFVGRVYSAFDGEPVIQRLKYFDLRLDGDQTHLTVELKAKDDHGWYVYEFGVRLARD